MSPAVLITAAVVALVLIIGVATVALVSRGSPRAVPGPGGARPAAAARPSAAAPAGPVAPTPHPQPVVVSADRSLNLTVFSQIDGRQVAAIPSGLNDAVTLDMNLGQDMYLGNDSAKDDVARTTFNQSLTRIAFIHKYAQDTVPSYWDIPSQKLIDVLPPADHSGFEAVDGVRTLGVAYDPGSENLWYVTADGSGVMTLTGPGYRRTIPGGDQQEAGTYGPPFRFPEPGRAPDVQLSAGDFNGRTGRMTQHPTDASATPFGTPPRTVFDSAYRTHETLPPTHLDPTDVLRADNDPVSGFFFTTTGTVGLWKVAMAGGSPVLVAPTAEGHGNVVRASVLAF